MSLFGGNTKNLPEPEIKPLGIDEQRASTSQQARPVPYLAGRQRIALTWLCNVFNVVASPIQQKIGKKKQTVGYSYSASFAGLICVGPLDSILKIMFDGEEVWSGELLRSGDSTPITIPNRGTATLYWGTETQTPDSHLLTSGEDHPAYRGQAYLVFNSLQLGQNRTQVPNIEVIVTRYPDPSWMTANPNIQGDANLVTVVAEWLQNPRFGLGLPQSRLDTDTLDDVAIQFMTEELGISPLITRSASARQLVVEALEYVDGYITTDAQGRLGLGLVRPFPTPGSLPVLDEGDLTEEPTIQPGSWIETENETTVVFSSREREFKEDTVSWRDAGNFRITGEHKPQVLQRPWCTRTGMAQRIAALAGKAAGVPKIDGSLTVRRSSAAALDVGAGFRLSYAHYGLTGLTARVTSRTVPSPSKPEVRLDWSVDRGDLNQEHFAPPVDPPPPDPTFDPVVNAYELILEAPFGLPAPAATEELILLAARGNLVVTGFNIHRKLPTGSFDRIGESERFAVRGHLLGHYPGDTTVIDNEVGLLVQIDSPDSTFENRDLEDVLTTDVLLYVGDEILCPFGAVLQSGTTWRIFAIRERYDTRRAGHAIGAAVWIQERALGAYIPSQSGEAVQGYKLQPYSINREVDLAGVAERTVTTTHRALRPLSPLNLAEGGDKTEASYTTGEDLELSWTITHEDRGQFWSLWGGGMTEGLPETVFEFRTTGDVLKATVALDPGVASHTYTNAQLLADFGSEVDVIVRAYHRRNSYLSNHYPQLTIRKV